MSSPSLTKTPKSQLAAEWPSTKKIQTYQKGCSTSKDREEAATRWQEGCIHNTLKSHTHQVSDPHWKIIVSQRLSHRSEGSEPQVNPPPQSVVLALGREAPRAFGFESQWGLITGTPQG